MYYGHNTNTCLSPDVMCSVDNRLLWTRGEVACLRENVDWTVNVQGWTLTRPLGVRVDSQPSNDCARGKGKALQTTESYNSQSYHYSHWRQNAINNSSSVGSMSKWVLPAVRSTCAQAKSQATQWSREGKSPTKTYLLQCGCLWKNTFVDDEARPAELQCFLSCRNCESPQSLTRSVGRWCEPRTASGL